MIQPFEKILIIKMSLKSSGCIGMEGQKSKEIQKAKCKSKNGNFYSGCTVFSGAQNIQVKRKLSVNSPDVSFKVTSVFRDVIMRTVEGAKIPAKDKHQKDLSPCATHRPPRDDSVSQLVRFAAG